MSDRGAEINELAAKANLAKVKMQSGKSQEINELAAALAIAQGQIKPAAKDNVAKIKMQSGGEFSYKYSTLDDIWEVARSPLSKNGLSVIQIPTNDENKLYLETILIHSSGQWISGTMILPIVAGKMSALQAMGSAITYARRYALGAMVGVTTGDDDDGHAAGDGVKSDPLQMDKHQLLNALNKYASIRGFFTKPDEIMSALSRAEWPDREDIDGWRTLLTDAKNHALEVLEDASPDSTPEESVWASEQANG